MPRAGTPAVYADLVSPSNEAIDRWNTAADVADLAAIREVSNDLALLLTDFAAGIAAAAWPEDARTHAETLVAGLAREVDWYRTVASSTDDEATAVALEAPWSDDAVDAAARLREVLDGA